MQISEEICDTVIVDDDDSSRALLDKFLRVRGHITGCAASLAEARPLLSGESENTSALSREHVVAHPVPGLVVVAGGKYTTYRVMARDAVDAAAHALDERVPPSCTERIAYGGSVEASAGCVLRQAGGFNGIDDLGEVCGVMGGANLPIFTDRNRRAGAICRLLD